jgi:DNA invertase Pin-like site-specific DNA recombinase
MFFNLLAAFAASEVELLRTREGMAIARPNGKLNGRQPKLSARQHAHLLELRNSGPAVSPA